jgi:predicted nucleic acid-binding protein
MAPRRWVVNASPLILLGKVEQIQLLSAMAGQIAVPRAVIREVSAKPDGERAVQTLTALEAAIIVDDEVPPANILSWDLGAGETQVIGHAVVHSTDRVVIDDLEARRCAQAMGLAIIGTLGIVGRAKVAGVIDRAGPVIQRLRETGLYASDKIVQQLLREVGE